MVPTTLTNHNGATMKKIYIILVFVALLVVSIFCIAASQYISNGCFWWECVPERDFHVSDWEIPLSLLPAGASTDPLTRPADNMFGENEGRFQDVYLDYRIATYEIYRFPRVKDAVFRFEQNKKGMVDRETGKVWDVPGDLTFSSPTVDDLYIACGYSSQIYSCEMTARYQEYVIFFKADINNQMTFAHFEKILFYLDEQISSRLYP
jgi:hypothetical protein